MKAIKSSHGKPINAYAPSRHKPNVIIVTTTHFSSDMARLTIKHLILCASLSASIITFQENGYDAAVVVVGRSYDIPASETSNIDTTILENGNVMDPKKIQIGNLIDPNIILIRNVIHPKIILIGNLIGPTIHRFGNLMDPKIIQIENSVDFITIQIGNLVDPSIT